MAMAGESVEQLASAGQDEARAARTSSMAVMPSDHTSQAGPARGCPRSNSSGAIQYLGWCMPRIPHRV